MLNKNIEIHPDVPLPHLDSPHAKAFNARDKRSPDRPMYVLLCHRRLPPRLDLVRGLSRMETAALIRPQAWGVVEWPQDGREYQMIAFDQPGGPRVVLEGPEGEPALRDDDIVRNVVPVLAGLLKELKGRMISHRAIRASNLFYADKSRTEVVLGECVSEPSGYSQPLVYETLEAGMADPSGRGSGYPGDDIYALGVLLLALLGGVEPCSEMSDEEIIDNKIRLGSYATMVRDIKVSISLMEPLRGMLCDSLPHRWTASDLENWVSGQRQSTKPHSAPQKMARPYEFNGLEYWHPSTLANAMARNWDAAVASHPASPLITWLRKAYGDSSQRNAFADKVQYVVASANKGEDAGDRVLANLLAVLDPGAPLRFRRLSAQPEALGQFLAIDFDDQSKIKDFTAAIRARLPGVWLELQPVARPEFVPLKKSIELTQFFIDREGMGFGLERCLYELNPAWPCQSPLLDRSLVVRIDQLVPALERLAAQEEQSVVPIDAHIAAFCAAHIKDLPKSVFSDLMEPEESVAHRLAVLALLARAQDAGRADNAPHLCRWMLRCLSPVITEFHNRPYRQKLGERLQALAERGRLDPMHRIASNAEARRRDSLGFERACVLFERSKREIDWLHEGGLTGADQVRKGSEQAALLVSSVISGTALLGLTLVMVL